MQNRLMELEVKREVAIQEIKKDYAKAVGIYGTSDEPVVKETTTMNKKKSKKGKTPKKKTLLSNVRELEPRDIGFESAVPIKAIRK